jgi:predicted secreted protein
MSWTTIAAIYFLIWWVVLFAVLPWGVRAQGASGPAGTDPGAPAVPYLGTKLLWTTIVSAVIFVFFAAIYSYRIITLDDLAALLGVPEH